MGREVCDNCNNTGLYDDSNMSGVGVVAFCYSCHSYERLLDEIADGKECPVCHNSGVDPNGFGQKHASFCDCVHGRIKCADIHKGKEECPVCHGTGRDPSGWPCRHVRRIVLP